VRWLLSQNFRTMLVILTVRLKGFGLMNCPKCGASVVDDAAFCSHCGTKLGADSATRVAPARTSHGPAAVSDSPEETLWEGRFSPKAMVATWIAMGLVDLALLGASIYMLATGIAYWWAPLLVAVVFDLFVVARYFYKRIGIRYRLSNHRFFHEEGILNRKVNPIDLITINDVAFEQGLIERMVGVGRVKIMSTDTTDPVLWVAGIENVQDVATMIDKTRREEMMRRRVFYDASPHG
jgi:membrane protein YdbS with pleckstrin-like domain